MSTVSIEIVGKYYTTEQAAKLLDLDVDTIRRYCNCDPQRLFAEKMGRDWFIPKEEIDRYKKERREPGRPPAE